MKNKHEVFRIFLVFSQYDKTQLFAKLQIVRADNGGEYDNVELQNYFHAHGLYHETSYSDTTSKWCYRVKEQTYFGNN